MGAGPGTGVTTGAEGGVLTATGMEGSLTIEVKNIEGITVYTQNQWPANEVLSFGKELSPGIYFVQVTDGSNVRTIKIVKGN